jgi:hypothetical protein
VVGWRDVLVGEVVGPSCSRQHAVREPGKKNAQAAQARRPARRRGLPKGPGVVVVLVMVVVVRGLLVGRCWSWSCSLLVVAWSAHVGPRPSVVVHRGNWTAAVTAVVRWRDVGG